MTHPHLHTSHPAIANRLKRAQGHLRSVIAMIEEGRSCVDIAQQLHAVEKAVSQAKRTLIHDHLDNCIDHAIADAPENPEQAVAEFKTIAKYL